ncbi:hypothetical protein WKI68_34480 [Streptomyces sp. MS1.HAVA.3]|uniref:Uncharacterized protein n=1 Tax=Streptomyces caledonius TaxID=3134107 RepID=A0ABU8UAP6_9ACTN
MDWLTFGYQQDWPGYGSLDEAHRHLRRRREAATGGGGLRPAAPVGAGSP